MHILLYNYDILSMIIMVHLIYFPIIINEPSLLVVLYVFFPYLGHNLSPTGRDDDSSFFARLVRDHHRGTSGAGRSLKLLVYEFALLDKQAACIRIQPQPNKHYTVTHYRMWLKWLNSIVYGRFNELVNGVYKPANLTGGHHPV